MLYIITGASRGIGFEMVKQLSVDPGNLIVAVSRSEQSLKDLVKKTDAGNILIVKADITRAAGRQLITKAVKRTGLKADVLINNAGELLNKPFEKIKEKELVSVYHTNVFAPFLLVQDLLQLFNKSSHIVNISSMGGFQGSAKFAGLSAYSSSKAALSGLTECLAEELKGRGIAVNCLAIGAVQTEMLSKAFPGYKAPLKPAQMAEYMIQFAKTGHHYYNGKVLPVSLSTP